MHLNTIAVLSQLAQASTAYVVTCAAEGDAAQAAVSHAASPAVSSQACPPSRAHVQLQALAASLDELDEVQAAGAQLVSQAATSPEGKDPARQVSSSHARHLGSG